ncbi:MAG: flavodoxin family protein [Prevotella sp.]|jgi:flavodoxin
MKRRSKSLMTVILAALMVVFGTYSCKSQDKKNADALQNTNNMKTLVVYYSLTGNTESIAKQIADKLGADIEKIDVVRPYEGSYQQIVDEANNEVQREYQRPIKPLKHSLKDYDRIIVGTPTWWYKMSSPILTFLSNNDFTGKTVVPFMTNAGWPGTVIEDMSRLARKNGAKVEHAHEFKFNTQSDGTTNGMSTPQEELQLWIDSLSK